MHTSACGSTYLGGRRSMEITRKQGTYIRKSETHLAPYMTLLLLDFTACKLDSISFQFSIMHFSLEHNIKKESRCFHVHIAYTGYTRPFLIYSAARLIPNAAGCSSSINFKIGWMDRSLFWKRDFSLDLRIWKLSSAVPHHGRRSFGGNLGETNGRTSGQGDFFHQIFFSLSCFLFSARTCKIGKLKKMHFVGNGLDWNGKKENEPRGFRMEHTYK